MQTAEKFDVSTLAWIKAEIDESLKQARVVLEEVAGNPKAADKLSGFVEALHQVHGTLKIVEIESAARFALEIEAAAASLLAGKVEPAESAFELLMRAVLQLPGFLEDLQEGQSDSLLPLLSLINDLRGLRGEKPLGELALFRPELDVAPPDDRMTGATLRAVAAKARPYLQTSLANLLRNREVDASLGVMAKVADALFKAGERQDVRQVFWVISGLIESLRSGGLELNAEIKKVLGKFEQLARFLSQSDEDAANPDNVRAVTRVVLYYLSKTTAEGALVGAIRGAFRLDRFSSVGVGSLSGFNAELKQTVAADLMEELGRVKDTLDVFVRGPRDKLDVLEPIIDGMRRLAETLEVLRQESLQEKMAEQAAMMQRIHDEELPPDDNALMAVAGALLAVESALGDWGAGVPLGRIDQDGDNTSVSPGVDAEHARVVRQVMKESKDDLVRAREAVNDYLEVGGDRERLADVNDLFYRIIGSLALLNYNRVAQVVLACSRFVRDRLLGADTVPPEKDLDRFADAIMGVEYYLEAFVEGRVHPGAALDVAESALASLGYPVDGGMVEELSIEEPADAGDTERDSVDRTIENEPGGADTVAAAVEPVAETGAESGASHASGEGSDASPASDDIDDEILQVFLEEAEEELERIRRLRPAWEANPDDKDTLKEYRRSFHTLKGSGRLVGAEALGEFAWAIENMLNKVIDGAITIGPQVFRLLKEAEQAVPELIENFRGGTPTTLEVTALAEAAHALGRGETPQFPVSPASETDETLPESGHARIDPELLDIYTKEANDYITTIEIFVADVGTGKASHFSLLRALHTLKGSSRIAGLSGLAAVNEVLEKCVKALQSGHRDFDAEGLAILEADVTLARASIAHLHDPSQPLPDAAPLLARAEALYASLKYLEPKVTPESGLDNPDHDKGLQQGAAAELAEPASDGPEGSEATEQEEFEPHPTIASEQDSADVASVHSADLTPDNSVGEEQEAYENDPELVDLFVEEGFEILDASDETLQRWLEAPDDRNLVAALQRQLHTLKGSARMAGINAVGDLSHSLESTFEAIAEGRLKRSEQLLRLVQQAHDRLGAMLDRVRERRPLPTSDDLVKEIENVGRGETIRPDTAPLAPPDGEDEEVGDPGPHDADSGSPTDQSGDTGRSGSDAETESPRFPEGAVSDPGQQGVGRTGFFIEAEPLVADFASAVQAWQKKPEDAERYLRTARIVTALEDLARGRGIRNVADLAAVTSMLMAEVRDGRVVVSGELFGLLQSIDERISRLIEQYDRGLPASDVQDLIDTIKEIVAGAAPGQDREEGSEAEGDNANRRNKERIQHEMVRVRRDLMDDLVNFAGEVSIYRSRVEQQMNSFRGNLGELDETVVRLREQLRQFDIETEAQITSRYQETGEYEDFDPLEFDRFTNMQQLSRSMMESLSDVRAVSDILLDVSRQSETLLLQQARVNTEMQERLLQTRMVQLVENAPRLRRIVRQTAAELDRRANLTFTGADVEMDRRVVERLMAPLEHMLRNAVAHGIETPQERIAAGKPEAGVVNIALAREGAEVIVKISDDGRGIDVDAVRRKAIERGLMAKSTNLGSHEIMQFIFEPGFSTAATLTQVAGRGIGMDVVNSEIRQLGGVLDIDMQPGQGTTFTIRLPLTLSVSRALLVHVGDEPFAIPLLSVQGIERIDAAELEQIMTEEHPLFRWVGEEYEMLNLRQILGIHQEAALPEGSKQPLLLAQSGDHRVALMVDRIVGSREIVIKSLGPQISTMPSLAGATILSDGSVALVLELPALIRKGIARRNLQGEMVEVTAGAERVPTVMIVDDSITVRAVTKRLLKRHNLNAIAAKDGVDALALLDETIPDVMLLDIEMPRMDGFELATHIRNSDKLHSIPIIMITSRTGEKHRQRALEIGVDEYMGKPYSESDLLENIEKLIGRAG